MWWRTVRPRRPGDLNPMDNHRAPDGLILGSSPRMTAMEDRRMGLAVDVQPQGQTARVAELGLLLQRMEAGALHVAEGALERMIRLAETATPGPETTSHVMIGRTLVAEAAIRTVERAMEVAGGAAFHRDLGIERAFRDVQGARFHPLQQKPQLRYTGRLALGLDIDG